MREREKDRKTERKRILIKKEEEAEAEMPSSTSFVLRGPRTTVAGQPTVRL